MTRKPPRRFVPIVPDFRAGMRRLTIYNNRHPRHVTQVLWFATRKECDVETRKQLTVFLENKPGRLAQILSALAQAKINIVALAVMDRQDQGVLRLVTENDAATRKMLQGMNQQSATHDVLAVELRNQPGALAHVCETLAGGHINVDYAYCSSGGKNGKVYGIFKVSNLDKAQRVLTAAINHNNRRVQVRPMRDQRAYRKV